MNKKGTGLRFNEGKLRYDLVNPYGHMEMVKVLTAGAQKYEERNWEKGMPWSKVIASLKRHYEAIERGEDYDKETGELHASHLACNAHFLASYYHIYPQGDDRIKSFLLPPKIGLDIDEVLADWLGAWMKRFHIKKRPTSWRFDRKINERFDTMRKNKQLDKFYLNLKPLVNPDDIPFEPHCYITSRPVCKTISEKWLDKHNFPTSPVYSVKCGKSKVEIAKEAGVEIFVDDNYHNFVELNNNGVFCYLYDTPHNRRYDVGHYRIKSLSDIKGV